MTTMIALLSLLLADAPADPATKPAFFRESVEEFTLVCEPAEAKPGQTVTVKMTLKLKDGYTVYPMKQTDEGAAGMVSKIVWPQKPGAVVFVGEFRDPAGVKQKPEPELGIQALKYYSGAVVWERTAVVNPNQPAGPATVTVPSVKFAVCDANNCFPPKGFSASAKLTVLPGPATLVEPKYAAEVAKALAAK